MLNKHNLSLAKLGSTEPNRFTLAGILVTPKETVVTDGNHLTRLTLPRMDPSSFPDVSHVTGKATKEFAPFIMPMKDAVDIAKALPSKTVLPVLDHAAIFEQSPQKGCAQCGIQTEHHQNASHGFQQSDRVDSTTVVVTDLERTKPFFVKTLAGNFPDYERITPRRENNCFEIAMDARLLKRLLDHIVELQKGERYATCILSFEDPSKAMQIFSSRDGQDWTSVVMPLRHESLQNQTFDRRKQIEEAVSRFKSAINDRVERNRGHIFLEAASAELYDTVRKLTDPEALQQSEEDRSEAEVVPEVGLTAEPEPAPDPIQLAKDALRPLFLTMKQTRGKDIQTRLMERDRYSEEVQRVTDELGEETALQILDEIEEESAAPAAVHVATPTPVEGTSLMVKDENGYRLETAPEQLDRLNTAMNAPTTGGWTYRMDQCQTFAGAQDILEQFEQAVNTLEKSAGLVPTVGEGAQGASYVGWLVVSPQQRANMVVRMSDPQKKEELRTLVMDGVDMLESYRKIQSREQDSIRARFASPAGPRSIGNTALAAKPAPTPVSGVRPERPADFDTWGPGRKAAWTRKHGKY